MNDTKTLLKYAGGNIVSILGYISTASTFLPVMAFLRPYLRPFGVLLIVVGIFRGGQRVIKEKDQQITAIEVNKKTEIDILRGAKGAEIADLNKKLVEARRKPYTEDMKRRATQVLHNQMTLEGRHAVRHLMIHEPIEVGRVFANMPQDRLHEQLAIAKESGIVQHKVEPQDRIRTYWIINPRFRPVLEDVLYEQE